MAFRPLGDRVLVKRAAALEVSKGGILIHSGTQSQEKPQEGEVIGVGFTRTEDGTVIPPVVSVGDKILFPKFAWPEIVIGEDKFIVMRESDILGVFDA